MPEVTVESFRVAFPEFGNPALYPHGEIEFWLNLAPLMHNAERYGAVLPYAMQLFIAHNLSIGAGSRIVGAASGGIPGAIPGMVTSASVDKVSYSRDASAAMNPANGHWNLSIYGLRWVQLQRTFGAGPLQVGVPSASDYRGGGWPGPMFFGQ